MLFRHDMSLEIIIISLIILFLFSVTAHKFQENLLRCMLQIENTFFELGESCDQDCLIICDRGAMDAAACNKIFLYDIININLSINKKRKMVLSKKSIVII